MQIGAVQNPSGFRRRLNSLFVVLGRSALSIMSIPTWHSDGRRHFEKMDRSRLWLFIVALFVLSQFANAQDQQMEFYNNRALVLTSCKFLDPVSSPGKLPRYAVLLQQNPFVEIHLEHPLRADQITEHHLFICDEVAIVKEKRSPQSWTIGKDCRPR